MARQLAHEVAGLRIPDPDQAIVASRQDVLAIGRENDAPNVSIILAREQPRSKWLARGQVPGTGRGAGLTEDR